MPVVAVFNGVYCSAEEVVEEVARRLGVQVLGQEVLRDASKERGAPLSRLARAMGGSPSFFESLTHDSDKSLIHIRAALARMLASDTLVYHGLATHLIPRTISHVLRVCLVADREHRVEQAAKREGLSPRAARKKVTESDQQLSRWTQRLFHRGPWDPSLYDVKIPMHTTSPREAAEMIVEHALSEALRPTRQSLQAVLDFQLATRVNVALLDRGHHYCDVTAESGEVTLIINKEVLRLEVLSSELSAVARTLEGVRSVRTRVGPQVNRPDIFRHLDFEVPARVLLVDDEQDFVLTLSERLQMRDFESEVVYSGEEALSRLEQSRPEVMVLDLRMPGMGGIEVLRRVKQAYPEVEVIILTGHGSDTDREMAMELGAFAYLRKPVDINLLSETMSQAQQRSRAKRAAPEGEEPQWEEPQGGTPQGEEPQGEEPQGEGMAPEGTEHGRQGEKP